VEAECFVTQLVSFPFEIRELSGPPAFLMRVWFGDRNRFLDGCLDRADQVSGGCIELVLCSQPFRRAYVSEVRC